MNTIIKPDILKGKDFSLLRCNPDRGWRLETYITLGSNTVMFNKGYTPEEFLDREFEHYKEIPIRTVQVYAYLTEYIKKPLDDKAFKQLENYLKLLKERKLKALLRFAYEFEANRKIGPTSQRIYSHIDQIKMWIQKNEELIKSTVLVLQAGFIGAWGEWHTAKYPHSRKAFISKICNMVPNYLTIQTRQQKFKDKIKDSNASQKVGYHDDYLIGVYHKWSTPKNTVGSQDFNRFVEDSLYTLNDGEMPWGRDKSYNKGYIDALQMIEGCRLRSLTTLSLTHNYTEDSQVYNAHRWQSEKILPQTLDKMGIPYFSTYFEKDAEKSAFDFLTDHLGYLLAVEKIEISDSKIKILIRNNGFALPHGFTDFKVYVKSAADTKEYAAEDFDFKKLTRGTSALFTVKADIKNAAQIGISLKKPFQNSDGLRFANICEFENNINFFKI